MSNVKRFFSYSPDGFELHETAKEAKAEAEAALSLWTDGEFTEGYLDIYWGEIRGAVHEEILHHHGPECQGENGCPEGHYGAGEHDYVGHCTLVDLPPIPDPEIERLRAEVEALQAEVEALREAWAEVRGVALGCIAGEPYGNEAASLILDTMDSMVPEWAGEAQAPPPEPPAAPAPNSPPPVAPPSPAPAPPQWRWEKEEAYRDGAWRVRGTLTHLPSGVSDTSGWWLDSGDAHAEAAQGVRNKLARSGK